MLYNKSAQKLFLVNGAILKIKKKNFYNMEDMKLTVVKI